MTLHLVLIAWFHNNYTDSIVIMPEVDGSEYCIVLDADEFNTFSSLCNYYDHKTSNRAYTIICTM